MASLSHNESMNRTELRDVRKKNCTQVLNTNGERSRSRMYIRCNTWGSLLSADPFSSGDHENICTWSYHYHHHHHHHQIGNINYLSFRFISRNNGMCFVLYCVLVKSLSTQSFILREYPWQFHWLSLSILGNEHPEKTRHDMEYQTWQTLPFTKRRVPFRMLIWSHWEQPFSKLKETMHLICNESTRTWNADKPHCMDRY